MRSQLKTRSNLDSGYDRAYRQSSPWWRAVAYMLFFYLSGAYAAALTHPSSAQAASVMQVSREWIDPCIGSRWQLKVNTAHPSWPGRLVLVDARGGGSGVSIPEYVPRKVGLAIHQDIAERAALSLRAALFQSVIRAGDRVVVVQQSKIMQAHFEAVALEPAALGERLQVQLSVGGSSQIARSGPVISVQATGAGMAQWAVPNEPAP